MNVRLLHLLEAVRDRVLFLFPRHAKVRDLYHVPLSDEAVASGEVTVDAVLGLEVLHAGRRVETHPWTKIQSYAKFYRLLLYVLYKARNQEFLAENAPRRFFCVRLPP